MRPYCLFAAGLLMCAAPLRAQEPVDTAVITRIRREGFERSNVMTYARTISDVYGPRLAGTAQYRRAAEWARATLAEMGLANAALEPWGPAVPGWELERFSVEMLAPHYLRLTAYPKAWSRPTAGTVSGTPILVEVRSDSDFAKYRGRLRGAIVLNGPAAALDTVARFASPAHRYTGAELDSLARLGWSGSPEFWEEYDDFLAVLVQRRRVATFFREEGVAALLEPSRNPAALIAQGYWPRPDDVGSNPPGFAVAGEHYDRLLHLLDAGMRPTLELSLAARVTSDDSLGYNVLAELPGSDHRLAAEVVMLGGHLDSWQAGTGATDNAAGSAVAMEVMRILTAIGIRPRRTIRVALWDGEEPTERYLGSEGYVARHFADLETLRRKPEHARLSAYFNLDNGTGRIRGVYLQGNEATRPIFAAWLAPFRDLGVTTVTAAGTSGTDHMSFLAAGLPAFQFIQDPIDYDTRTHHTALDVADSLLESDLQQAAVVMAAVVYHAAMRAEKMPRRPLPAPRHPR